MKNKTLLFALMIFAPMSAYAASNTAKVAYHRSEQAIVDSAIAKGLAQKDSLAEQVLQMDVNTDVTNARTYTNQAVNGILGEANSNTAVSIEAADKEQDAELAKQVSSTLAQAQGYASKAQSSALSYLAKGDATTLASANDYTNQAQAQNEQSFTTKRLQIDGSSTVTGNETVNGTLTANGANMDNNVIQNVVAGTTGTDAANVNQVQQGDAATLHSANSYTDTKVKEGDSATLKSADNNAEGYASTAQKTAISASNSYTNTKVTEGDAKTLKKANGNAKGYASTAQSNSEAYASTTAQADAQQAQSNAENFAQGAANQAQRNADQYAASGIAAALAMPSSPYLRPGHYAVGIQAATYGGEQGFGARATYQINSHWSANAGVAGGTGIYGQVGGTVGVQYEG